MEHWGCQFRCNGNAEVVSLILWTADVKADNQAERSGQAVSSVPVARREEQFSWSSVKFWDPSESLAINQRILSNEKLLSHTESQQHYE